MHRFIFNPDTFNFLTKIKSIYDVHWKKTISHFSSINSENSFKKLYPGENVSLNVVKNTNDSGKEYTCSNVTGLYGTPLLVDLPDFIIKVIKKKDTMDRGEVDA